MNHIQENFRKQFINSFWDQIKFYFLRLKIRRQKLASLYEASLDKLYLETEYPNILSYDDSEDRKLLGDENRKPLESRDEKAIVELEEKIAKAKAIKQTWKKNEDFMDETKHYLNMMDRWNQTDQD